LLIAGGVVLRLSGADAPQIEQAVERDQQIEIELIDVHRVDSEKEEPP
jgi:hypothetical protein